uniref:Uncharacterized protein n=1 Tax=Marseillevirus LCMAC101 TaxID=2506602 RepID=A0A481YT17_9VIRU|nr:MAG: hypothetical protein LCMAC101_07020 [Marseillevirus LCMAC101]
MFDSLDEMFISDKFIDEMSTIDELINEMIPRIYEILIQQNFECAIDSESSTDAIDVKLRNPAIDSCKIYYYPSMAIKLDWSQLSYEICILIPANTHDTLYSEYGMEEPNLDKKYVRKRFEYTDDLVEELRGLDTVNIKRAN